MRISDWSSDVCSSDLTRAVQAPTPTSRKGTDYAIQTCRAALRANARTGNAIPTRRSAMGRTDWLGPRTGEKLAIYGVRRTAAHHRPVFGTGLAVDAEPGRSDRKSTRLNSSH